MIKEVRKGPEKITFRVPPDVERSDYYEAIRDNTGAGGVHQVGGFSGKKEFKVVCNSDVANKVRRNVKKLIPGAVEVEANS